MTMRTRPTRRGVALLLVLAVVVVAVPLTAGVARYAAAQSMRDRFDEWTLQADALARAVEADVALTWLVGESGSVVLPPETTEPRVEIINDRWRLKGIDYAVQLAAFDGQGMAPLVALRSASPMRLALPADALDRIDEWPEEFDGASGMDLLAELDRASGDEMPIFPIAAVGEAHWFGADDDDFPSNAGSTSSGSPNPSPALGALVATHQSARAGVINVNTAPIELLEAAMAQAGRGGLEAIIAARAQGQPAPLPAAAPGRADSNSPAFVGQSSLWCFRLDVRVGAVKRSWWLVYTRGGNAGWECVQRLGIDA